MTTEAITPLRQRMIEDMNARKLCSTPWHARGVSESALLWRLNGTPALFSTPSVVKIND